MTDGNRLAGQTASEGPHNELAQAMQTFLAFSPEPDIAGDSPVRVFFAPGRVNLIGEHTDYNGGHVLPAALTLGTWVFARVRRDKLVRIASTSFSQVVEVASDEIHYSAQDDYANYPKGVLREFQKLGFDIPGLDLLYVGNLPSGAGLSSSASIEVVTASMLNEMLGADLAPERLALMSQAAENQFVGVNCGIMDQFAVALGKANHAISLNCDTLDYQRVPMQIAGVRLVIINTNKRRGLADSKYNERRGECEQALCQMQRVRPGIRHLADLDEAEFATIEATLQSEVLRKRARHVVTENQRAKQAVDVLRRNEIALFGQMMNASHVSLRDDYEVTGFELDTLAEVAWRAPGCIGARMTGAGFGGCTVNLVQADCVEAFIVEVRAEYTKIIGYEPSFYITDLGDGVKEVTREMERDVRAAVDKRWGGGL